MKLVTLKTANEVNLGDVKVEFVKEDTTLKEVILTTKAGEVFIIKHGESYSSSVRVLRRQEFDTKEVYRLTGSFCGVKVCEDYESEREADRRGEELALKDANAELKVKKTTVKVDDSGVPLASEDIPF